jgi:hypothetical protein
MRQGAKGTRIVSREAYVDANGHIRNRVGEESARRSRM